MLLLEALTVCSVTNLKGKKKTFREAMLKFNEGKYYLYACHNIVGRVGQEAVLPSCLQSFQDYKVIYTLHRK